MRVLGEWIVLDPWKTDRVEKRECPSTEPWGSLTLGLWRKRGKFEESTAREIGRKKSRNVMSWKLYEEEGVTGCPECCRYKMRTVASETANRHLCWLRSFV